MTSNGDSSAPPPASQPPLDTPQDASSPHQSQQRRYNLRTNPTTVPIALDDKSICDKIRHLQVRQPVTVKWSYHPHVDVLESKGVVVCRSNAGVSVDIEYANGPLQGVFPLPPTKDREKTHIYDVVPTPLMSIPAPPLRSVGEILQDGAPDRPLPKEPIAVVFADGGSRSFAPAAAAVTIRTKEHGIVQDARYGKFYSSGTNNQTELSALIGAMRLIITKFATNVGNDGVTPARITLRGPVVLVVDSELALKMTVGAIQAKDEVLRTLVDTASDLYRRLACGGTDMQLYHMYRDAHNPADDVANAVMNSGNHINDASAFPDIPDQRKRALKPAVEVAPIVVVEDHELLDINTVDEFIALRRYKVRSCVQPALVPLWSTLVTRQAQRVLKAETAEDRDKQIIELLLLPTRYLPANAATTRIQQHLRDQVPFKVNERQSTPQRVPDADGETHRLAEAARRLAADRKVRTANGLISAQADAGDMAFDEKLRLLKTKFVPSKGQASQFAQSMIPPIAAREVRTALRNINRQAATSIDGWSKDLVNAAVSGNPGLAHDLAAILTIVISQPISALLTDILRAGRLVGIPKSPTAVRPIAIANIWLKILGSITMARDSTRPHMQQFAVGKRDGCLQIIHQVRSTLRNLQEECDEDVVVVKMDLSNAFNETMRKHVAEVLATHPVLTQQYWRLAYGGPSPLAVFGPGGFEVLSMEEGIRQGDSTSSWLFCLGVDGPLKELFDAGFVHIWMYCDDLTVVVPRSKVEDFVQHAVTAFNKIGLHANPDKTDIWSPRDERTTPFVLLGCDLANTNRWFSEKLSKLQRYFDLIDRLPLHAQLKMVLLRLCGSPRVKYICSAVPAEHSKSLVAAFSARLRKSVGLALDLASIPDGPYHDSRGCGIPDWVGLSDQLFKAARSFALRESSSTQWPELVTTNAESSAFTAPHNLDAHWLWYDGDELTVHEFRIAFAMRLGIVPQRWRCRGKCECGQFINTDEDQITHTLKCDRFTTIGHTTRHNMVRDEMARVARRYGISVSTEPTFYSYSSGIRQRPDITFHTELPVATDVTVVYPTPTPGEAASKARAAKYKTHDRAVKALNHRFVPAAFEAYGSFDHHVTRLISTIAAGLPPTLQYGFTREMQKAIAISLAKGRATAVITAKHRRDGYLEG